MLASARLSAPARMGMLLLAILPLMLCGCDEESTDGNVTRYSYPLWTTVVTCGMSVILGAMGFLVREWSARLGYLMMTGAPFLLFFGVGILLEQVAIDSRHLNYRLGALGFATQGEVDFDLLESITLSREIWTRRRGGRLPVEFIHFKFQDGTTTKLNLAGLVRKVMPRIRENAAARRIEIFDLRAEPIEF